VDDRHSPLLHGDDARQRAVELRDRDRLSRPVAGEELDADVGGG
jgi:hypothetical protein